MDTNTGLVADFIKGAQDGTSYFKEIEGLGLISELSEIKYSKDARIFNNFFSDISTLKRPNLDNIYFKKSTKAETLSLAKEIASSLYEGKYDEKLDNIFSQFKTDPTLTRFDGAVSFDLDFTAGKKRFLKGIIRSLMNIYSSSILVHEGTHVIFEEDIPRGFNFTLSEILPIFSDFYSILQLDKKYGDEALKKYLTMRLWNIQGNYQEFLSLPKVFGKVNTADNKQLNALQLGFKYSYHQAYTYLISTIYAIQLYLCYLDNPTEVLQDYRKTVAHEISIKELLDKYNVNLRNRDNMNETKRLIKSVTS